MAISTNGRSNGAANGAANGSAHHNGHNGNDGNRRGGHNGRARNAQEEVDLRDVWHLLRRNRLLIGGCLIGTTLAAAGYTFWATPLYEAPTSIRIDEKQSNLPVLDILKSLTSGSEVGTEMQVLQSRTLAEDVVDSLGLSAEMSRPRRVARGEVFAEVRVPRDMAEGEYRFTRAPGNRFEVYAADADRRVGDVAPGRRVALGRATVVLAPSALRYDEIRVRVRPFQEAVDLLSKSLKVVRPDRDGNLVFVRYRSTDSILVREVPNALASRFVARRQSVQKTEARSTVAFLREQLDALAVQLAGAENALRSYRESAQVVDLGAEANAQVSRLAAMQADRNGIDAERAALAKLLVDVDAEATGASPDQPSPYRRLVAFPTLLRNQATTELLRSLAVAEGERVALLARRTPQDPDVEVLTARVRELEEQLRSIAVTYLQGLTNQVASLDATLAQFGKQLERIPAREMRIAGLQRRPKVLDEIYTLLQTRLKEAEIAEAVEDPSVRVVDAAITPSRPLRPNVPLNLVLGVVLGGILGVVTAFVRESMDRAVHTREDLQLAVDIPVLGLIPRIGGAAVRARAWRPQANGRLRGLGAPDASIDPRVVVNEDPRNPVSEAYRALRTNITFARPDQRVKSIVFTSPLPGDGKTTTTANFAVTLAQQGLKVILIDADLRRGRLHGVLAMRREPGLSNALLGGTPLESAVQRVALGDHGAIDFLATGTLPPNPAELLGSPRMRTLLARLAEEYDAVLIDAPPLNVVTDAAVLGTSVDGVVLVARSGVTVHEALGFAAEQLRNVRAPVLGAVLNDVDFKRDAGHYGSYGYYQTYYAVENN